MMHGNTLKDRIPADGLKRLMLIGYVSLSGPVLDFLIRNRVETVFVTPTGRFRARLALEEHKHVALRRAQYLRLSDPAVALDAARRFVRGKLRNMARFMRYRADRYAQKELKTAAMKIKSMAEHAETVDSMEILRGLEGAGSRIYFAAFPLMIRNDDFGFTGRNRRPPRDPVNAMLSFVYTLLTNEVLSSVTIAGLDPYLGALHEVSYGRPSLACDLVEEYRAFLGDRLVLGLINRKAVRPTDFIIRRVPEGFPESYIDETEMRQKRPVEMTPPAARNFIAAYETLMARTVRYPYKDRKVSYRWLIRHQARRFGEFLEGNADYEPFVWET